MMIKKIKHLIKKNGYSNKAFAEKLELSEQGFYYILRDTEKIKIETLRKMSEILNVSIHEFFIEETEKNYKTASELQIENKQLIKRIQELEEQVNDKRILSEVFNRGKILATFSTYVILSKNFKNEDIFGIMNSLIRDGFDYDTIKEIDNLGIDKYIEKHEFNGLHLSSVKDEIDLAFKK